MSAGRTQMENNRGRRGNGSKGVDMLPWRSAFASVLVVRRDGFHAMISSSCLISKHLWLDKRDEEVRSRFISYMSTILLLNTGNLKVLIGDRKVKSASKFRHL